MAKMAKTILTSFAKWRKGLFIMDIPEMGISLYKSDTNDNQPADYNVLQLQLTTQNLGQLFS
uniref:Uncharacterized protein n=1 Tax=Romanomermis culicivorax TaxID=13658 RepID=A0A915I625_ROMCU